ncbi:membrane protein [Clostridium novyi A str. 4570]|uniref:Membrane protein n=2 Tax=Clostridium novyi TaxID=1542 RepID=A0AA89CPU6_CLONO|nr:membrane protein [Clostridium novyi A str. 4570]
MKGYIYLILLTIMLFIIYKGFKDNLKKSPHKIKVICIFAFLIMFIRYLTLFGFFFVQNIRYLYLFKYGYFLNLLAIPLTGLVVIYIFMRDYKIKFSLIFPITIALSILYGFIVNTYNLIVKVDIMYGYYMRLENSVYIYIGYMLINIILIVLAINIYKPNLDKKGIVFVIVSSMITVLETLFFVIGKGVFIELVIGDILWMLTLNYGISKLKKPGK